MDWRGLRMNNEDQSKLSFTVNYKFRSEEFQGGWAKFNVT